MQKPVIKSTKRHPAAHGGGVRGDNSTPRSSLFEGLFGRMFRSLPAAAWTKEALAKLGTQMTSDPELDLKGLPAAAPETKDRIQDDEENAGISAGYTYLGQFIDHDITFDPASSLQQLNDPDALVDFPTPRLDLDSLYGRGPDDQPYMYDGKKFRLGRPLTENGTATNARDLPRYKDINNPNAAKRALIGDKRNDENVIVSQLHAAMLQFHNKLVDQNPSASFRDHSATGALALPVDRGERLFDEDMRRASSARYPATSRKAAAYLGKPATPCVLQIPPGRVHASRVLGSGLPVWALDGPADLPPEYKTFRGRGSESGDPSGERPWYCGPLLHLRRRAETRIEWL